MTRYARSRRSVASADTVATSLVLRVRVMFASTRPGGVEIDLIDEDGGHAIGVDAALPRTMWAAAASAHLERWAVDSTSVELRVVHRRSCTRIRLTAGMSAMLLDVRAVVPRLSELRSLHAYGHHGLEGTPSQGLAMEARFPGNGCITT